MREGVLSLHAGYMTAIGTHVHVVVEVKNFNVLTGVSHNTCAHTYHVHVLAVCCGTHHLCSFDMHIVPAYCVHVLSI